MNLNKVFIMGRLTADPEIRSTPSGERVTTISIASNRFWTDKSGNKKESTEFHNVVLWGRQADIAGQFLVKGSMAFIEGRLQTRSWKAQDNTTRKVTEIIAERLQFGPRASNGTSQSSAYEEKNSNQDMAIDEVPIIEMGDDGEIKPEDLPF